MRPALRAIRADSASSSVSLPSSDGWNWKNGNWIQRRDPRVEKPSRKTTATSRDRADVEQPLEAPQALDVEEREEAERDPAEAQVDLLAHDERIAAGARADDVEPERGHAGDREQHQPVEPAHAPERAHAPGAAELAGAYPLAGDQDANSRRPVHDGADVRPLDLEVLGVEVERGERARDAAMAAALDHDRRDELRDRWPARTTRRRRSRARRRAGRCPSCPRPVSRTARTRSSPCPPAGASRAAARCAPAVSSVLPMLIRRRGGLGWMRVGSLGAWMALTTCGVTTVPPFAIAA